MQIYTTKEVAQKFKVTTRSIQNYRDLGLIGFLKIKGKILYTEEHLQAFLKTNEVKPFAEQ